MPCYDPPPTEEEKDAMRVRAYQEGDWGTAYRLTPRTHIEQWLCDALRGGRPSDDCMRWWELHRLVNDKE